MERLEQDYLEAQKALGTLPQADTNASQAATDLQAAAAMVRYLRMARDQLRGGTSGSATTAGGALRPVLDASVPSLAAGSAASPQGKPECTVTEAQKPAMRDELQKKFDLDKKTYGPWHNAACKPIYSGCILWASGPAKTLSNRIVKACT